MGEIDNEIESFFIVSCRSQCRDEQYNNRCDVHRIWKKKLRSRACAYKENVVCERDEVVGGHV